MDERFWNRVSRVESGCWEWTGFRDRRGYGRLNRAGVYWLAHRYAWHQTHGSVPTKPYELDHLCRNTSCVNPSHLQSVTHRENNRRGVPKNRTKTHCPKGHEYSPENTYWAKVRGEVRQRQCKACRAAYQRNLRARHRGENPAWKEREREINREHYARNRLNPEWRAKENARTLAAYHRRKDRHTATSR